MTDILIIGGGPAGLMAAETAAKAGRKVTVIEKKPSLARKFLMAGRGGLNLTHSEPIDHFMLQYGAASPFLRPYIERFTPDDLRAWSEGLGEKTFIGTSGRVFPASFKASPLLRAWQKRLNDLGVTLRLGTTWDGQDTYGAKAVILALGGASWPRLGSDGGWVPLLQSKNINVNALRPANCGFHVPWTDLFREKFAGTPLKGVTLSFKGRTLRGEAMISAQGIEGGLIYAFSAALRTEIEQKSRALFKLDLKPDISLADLSQKISGAKKSQSLGTTLRKAGLSAAAASLVFETLRNNTNIAAHIKSIPIETLAAFPIDRAISSAGGIALDEVDENLMLKKWPGVFVCGEMLDWEAPTGGYLLQGCLSTGVAAGLGAVKYLS
jgi:uncharacterized flavoprotein (TIGR03862 family)